MKIALKNIGIIGNAEIEINGITVIAGENNTGKSTIGKSLYSVFNSFFKINDKIKKERIKIVENILDFSIVLPHSKFVSIPVETRDLAEKIIETDEYKENIYILEKFLMDNFFCYFEDASDLKDEKFLLTIQRIEEVLKISDLDIFKIVMQNSFNSEFNNQINNIFNDNIGVVELDIQDKKLIAEFLNNSVINLSDTITLKTEAIYIDDPFVLNTTNMPSYRFNNYFYNHRYNLLHHLLYDNNISNVVNEAIVNNKFVDIYEKINSVFDGKVVKNRNNNRNFGITSTHDGQEKIISSNNISAGLKTFVILKTLLMNGTIEYNGTIILDEPEIHLHPQWQLLFAEIIVLIQKEFNMHILINTHSPYFLKAIEVYSAKYEIDKKCKYYKATNKNNISFIEDVTDDVESIYYRLAQPLQILENEIWG